jgi:hypothetical protein
MAMMDNVSRPLIALLVGTVALFALWFVALKPGSSSSGSGSPGPAALQSDVGKAHHAVALSNATSAAQGADPSQTPSSQSPRTAAANNTAAASTSTATRYRAKPAATVVHSSAATRHRLDVVSGALKAKKVLALLFYNPPATDDRAVKQELAAVPVHAHRVVKLAVPITELGRYQVVTTQVPVNQSPTLVLIDRAGQATTIVGFADRFEIAHRVAGAAAAP